MVTDSTPDLRPRGRAVTLSEVARLAGVSRATASKALNDRFDVNEETRSRVRRIADQLHFRPNANARSLLTGRTSSVGILTDDLDGRFAPQIMVGAEDALGAERSSVLLSNTRGDPHLEALHLASLLERRVDGIIAVGQEPTARAPIPTTSAVPVVYAFAPSTDPADLSVISDNTGGGALAVEHMLELGRSRVVHLGGPVSSVAAQDRAAGARRALAAAGLPHGPFEILFGDWLEQWGWEAIHRLVEQGSRFDAVSCGNDQIARGAVDALSMLGIRVPEDVAVVGFDNWEVLSLHGRLPLSSVDLDLKLLGSTAARLLSHTRDGAGGPVVSPARLVARRSTLG